MRPLLPLLMTILLVCGGGPIAHRDSGDRIVHVAQLTSAGPDVRSATPRPVVLEWEPTPAPTPTPAPVTPQPAAKPAVKTTAKPQPKATSRPVTQASQPRATAKPAASSAPKTAASTPKPPGATPKPGPAYDKEDVKERIRASWPGEDPDKAVRVVDCETAGTFNPRMTSYNGQYYGLWQFDSETWHRHGGTGDPRDHTPEEQTRVAWKLFEARGWTPWPHCGQK